MRLSGHNLTLSYDDAVIARDLDIEIPDGKITVLIGPNGSGKSTILRALARLLKPKQGDVVLDGHSIQKLSTRDVAQRLAILPQLLTAPETLSVEDLVWYGRHPHRTSVLSADPTGRSTVDWALQVTSMQQLRHHPVDHLSGGQRQRDWIALCLAQGTDLLLLDEPTTFLDLAYQLDVLELLARLNQTEGKTIVMVLHDINMSGEYADHVIAVREGKVVAQGPPSAVITVDLLRGVFGLESQIMSHPITGKPMCIPIRAPHAMGANECPAGIPA